MNKTDGRKTEQSYWDAGWNLPVKAKLPSRLNVGVLNTTRLLSRFVKPGDRFLEIGCAPGKTLAWVASVLKADATGLDYSAIGVEKSRELFRALHLNIPVHHEDLFQHSLPLHSFDVVASFGVIEHFDDPVPAVQKHLELVKPGGVALISVPNYGGIYGRLQGWCNPPNLALHNLRIMNPEALRILVPDSSQYSTEAYAYGAISPWIVQLEKRLPAPLAKILALTVNAAALLQPFSIKSVAPALALEVRRRTR